MNDQISISPYDNLPVAVYTCDENGYLTSYNKAAVELWGRMPEIGKEQWCGSAKIYSTDGSVVPLDDCPVARVINGKKVIPKEEIIIQQPDGQFKNVWISAVPTFDEFKNLTGSINTLVDITEQKIDENKQAMLASIVESSEDAIISKTLEGIITTWNQTAVSMFGYSEYEALGQHISLIIPKNRLAEEKLIIDKIKSGEKVDHFESIRINKLGIEIPISLTVSPIKNLHEKIIGASKVVRDISKQKLAEERLQHYAAHLEELVELRTHSLMETVQALQQSKEEVSQSLEIEKELGKLKSRFVSMASHEFRTPLGGIQLSASLIEKYALIFDSTRISKHVAKIKNAVGNLTTILNDFLSLEKLETGRVELTYSNFDMVKLAEEITEEMQLVARHNQNIIYQHTGINSMVNLDQNLLKNCVFNLLSNAIKYSGEDTFIEFNTDINEQNCIITVKDNGIGIPENDQKNLFEAFFRAHNTGNIPGTGLGLNIVARYTGLMKGKIDFKSSINKGTQFTLSFPLH